MLNPVLEELVTRRQINDNRTSRVAHPPKASFRPHGQGLDSSAIAEQLKEAEGASRASGQGKCADDVDYDTILLPDSDVFPRRVLPDTSLLKMEDDYWSKFNMKWTGMLFLPRQVLYSSLRV